MDILLKCTKNSHDMGCIIHRLAAVRALTAWRVVLFAILATLPLGQIVNAQTQSIVPAGTLLQCTLDEPRFSSATANVGDPVVCYLKSVQQFGHIVFPRGSYLEGHLEDDKNPGHFWGKGYLKLEFDRIGLPSDNIPVPIKVIAAGGGYKSDREGDIVGKGHAKRDVVEWMLPPLWPVKFIMLPARGPRPTLKGEELLTLRLMDDVVVPTTADLKPALAPGWHYFDEPSAHLRNNSLPLNSASPSVADYATADVAGANGPTRITRFVLKSHDILEVTSYRIDRGLLTFTVASGATGSTLLDNVDWTQTSTLSAQHVTTAQLTSRLY